MKLTPEELDAAKRTTVYVVRRKRLNPSLDGDGSDWDDVEALRSKDEAEAVAKKLEKEDPDSWNAYSVSGVALLSWSTHPATVRALLKARA